MYIVTIENNGALTEIHGEREKLASGSVVKGINSIDTFSFSMLPSNIGFNMLHDFKTLVKVYNTRKNRYEFYGRVLCANPSMSDSGLIKKEVTCENYFGFLCDSVQPYVVEQNWTVTGLLQHLIDQHNAQMEEYKHFTLGEVTVTDPNDNLYLGIQRENTWEAIKKKLLDVLGGEIRFRVVDGKIYLDYLTELGATRSTKIALSRNMKSIRKELDPSAYITRLIPLGCKLKEEITSTDEAGNETVQTMETENRLEITEVNDGKNYIDDVEAIAAYGLHVGFQTWDDVTEADNLLAKGRQWLAENNKAQIKYTVTALDLSLLGLDIDDFNVCNRHPIENKLLGIDDLARIIKETIDICEETKSNIEIGANFKTLSDIQIENQERLEESLKVIEKIESNYVTNQAITDQTLYLTSLINQTAQSIISSISEEYVSISNEEEYRAMIETQLALMSDEIMMKFTTTTEQITTVDGELQSKFTELYKYIRFSGEAALIIGSGDSAITLEIDNETGIVFKKNGVQFGWWDGEDFHTGNIVVEVNERAQFGNFAFIPRSDNSLSFLKVKD